MSDSGRAAARVCRLPTGAERHLHFELAGPFGLASGVDHVALATVYPRRCLGEVDGQIAWETDYDRTETVWDLDCSRNYSWGTGGPPWTAAGCRGIARWSAEYGLWELVDCEPAPWWYRGRLADWWLSVESADKELVITDLLACLPVPDPPTTPGGSAMAVAPGRHPGAHYPAGCAVDLRVIYQGSPGPFLPPTPGRIDLTVVQLHNPIRSGG